MIPTPKRERSAKFLRFVSGIYLTITSVPLIKPTLPWIMAIRTYSRPVPPGRVKLNAFNGSVDEMVCPDHLPPEIVFVDVPVTFTLESPRVEASKV